MAKGIEQFRPIEAKEVGNKEVEQKLAAIADISNEYVKSVKENKEIALMKFDKEQFEKHMNAFNQEMFSGLAKKFGVENAKFTSLAEMMENETIKSQAEKYYKRFMRIGNGDAGLLAKEKQNTEISTNDKIWLANMYAKNADASVNQQKSLEKGIEMLSGSVA